MHNYEFKSQLQADRSHPLSKRDSIMPHFFLHVIWWHEPDACPSQLWNTYVHLNTLKTADLRNSPTGCKTLILQSRERHAIDHYDVWEKPRTAMIQRGMLNHKSDFKYCGLIRYIAKQVCQPTDQHPSICSLVQT